MFPDPPARAPLGWLYARHRTLVGVALSHALSGLWAVFVVGIEGVLL